MQAFWWGKRKAERYVDSFEGKGFVWADYRNRSVGFVIKKLYGACGKGAGDRGNPSETDGGLGMGIS